MIQKFLFITGYLVIIGSASGCGPSRRQAKEEGMRQELKYMATLTPQGKDAYIRVRLKQLEN